MDTFLKNYWSLYLDFLKDFEKLTYKGYSLPYLCHLPSFILKNESLLSELDHKTFANKLKRQVNDQKEFQEVFNTFMQSHQRPLVKNKQGKVVIHYDKLLRFPVTTLSDYFDPSRTILLTKGNKSKIEKARKAAKKRKQQKSKVPSKTKNLKGKNKAKAKLLDNTVNLKGKKTKKNAIQKVSTKANNNTSVKKVKKPKPPKKKIPFYHLSIHAVDTKNVTTQVQNKAKTMLRAYEDHHLYKRSDFQTWFLNNIATVIYHLEMTRNFLKTVSVSCVVVSTTHSFRSRILALVAAEKGIPTICMQHGIISSELGYIPKIATIDAVYGNFEKNWYKKIGAPDGSVEVIGHPRFDQIFSSPKLTRSQFYQKLGLDPNKKTIMIAVREARNEDKWRTLIETISKKINLNILIKNYPSSIPHSLTKEFSFVYSTQNYNMYDLFPYVDAVVTYSSTVGLEAMFAKKNVFILKEDIAGYTGYYEGLDKLVQTDPTVLGNYIIEYFSQPNFKSYAESKRINFLANAYPDSRKSGARLRIWINRLIY
ncbi:hypothetical protein ACFSTA_20625 [Ornithinibacillus salinisoli]|uniref:Lipid-A-disaccharide synthase n=1 Tax=Ornithinibacillus salinisoli TaxID=1848459 RepID=A0ABW4W4K5_9BACI